ncbi:hypothetical protein H072_1380 [Dactylellina haptotyla CBS 200.50]|uniref:VHS domain-containing protein n=1 Tax=Dactylellina haptotyla (strain CBS 200.50) TaxID=1284197 RepID=S8AUE2_DACHA|nr:hypothetical protein H072_1380 [Dactylellina haptotyla CBS 200.50]
MAARDRWNMYPAEPHGSSQLQRFIHTACDPMNFEPNLALQLEIADLINSKKGNTPREAAVAIVGYINGRNPNVSLLALSLLDICVKNCGYPFHLQISTKDFLNELVRRFPERPPIRYSRVQMKILEAVEEWKTTICQNSRYKEDLGFIRDMHRLLSYKGYVFPEIRKEDMAVLNPSENLKSAEELEEEERAAQSAKLQELIRRGTPQDLQEANQLMKIMAGYDQTNKTDYRQKAAEDIAKLQEKQRLLDEMLAKVNQGENIGDGDAFEELANALRNAQPKLHKMAEEESDDAEAVAKLFTLNDTINATIEKYKLLKKGDYAGAAAVKPGAVPEGASSIDLIDLMGDEISSNGTAANNGKPGNTGSSLEDDLLGLSIGGSSSGGGIALGFGANSNIPGPPLLSSTLNTSTARGATPDFSLGNFSASNHNRQASVPSPPSSMTSPLSSMSSPPASMSAFAGLGGLGSSPRPPPQPQAQTQPQAQLFGNDDDDDFAAFSSAVPPSSRFPPLKNTERELTKASLRIVMETFTRSPADGPLNLKAKFSNTTSESIEDITFQLAVPRSLQLKMEHQSGTTLQPQQVDGIDQTVRITGVAPGAGGNVKMRWKVSYRIGDNFELKEENGEITGLPVS